MVKGRELHEGFPGRLFTDSGGSALWDAKSAQGHSSDWLVVR